MDASGVVTTLHTFDGTGGQEPLASLIQASDGMFYGTTSAGGANGVGVVFRIESTGDFALMHSFDRYVDGARPVAELLEANGNLYGSTKEGGSANLGTLFRMHLVGGLTTIHIFEGADGMNPSAALIQATSGELYGTTSDGGGGEGSVFRIDASETLFTVHGFLNLRDRRGYTAAPLVQGSDGAFYGTNWAGMGASQNGTVFRMTDSGMTNRSTCLRRNGRRASSRRAGGGS